MHIRKMEPPIRATPSYLGFWIARWFTEFARPPAANHSGKHATPLPPLDAENQAMGRMLVALARSPVRPIPMWIHPIDATVWWNRSAGVS
jgi:hypothetical protein